MTACHYLFITQPHKENTFNRKVKTLEYKESRMRVLSYIENIGFVWRSSFEDRHIARINGFRFSESLKLWYTKQIGIACRLREYADDIAKSKLNKVLLTYSPWAGRIPFPEGLKPYDFQIDLAVPWALSRNRSYLGLDAGMGKTICAALILNALDNVACIYICPPFLKLNVKEEFTKWKHPSASWVYEVLSDTSLHKLETQKYIRDFTKNFKGNSILFVDEAHRFKNDNSRRSTSLFASVIPHFEKVVYLSGTPMPNRPLELYTVLNNSAPETINFMNKFEYGKRYCAARKNQWGWDFSGASNVPELASKIKANFLLRLKAKDHLKSLSPTLEKLVFIGENLPHKVGKLEKGVLKNHSPEDLMKFEIGADLHIASYRRELGLAKAESAVEYLNYLLTETKESILVFAIHKDVIALLEDKLKEFKPFVITGAVKPEARQGIVKKFQADKSRRLMLLNIQAGGIGLNLQKASRVVFAEYSWVDAENEQAFKRADRIGQDKRVIVDYLVFRNSLDRTVMEIALKKRSLNSHV